MNWSDEVQRAAGQCRKLKAEERIWRADLERATQENDKALLEALKTLIPDHLRNNEITCISPARGYDWHGVTIALDTHDHHGLTITMDDEGKRVCVEHTEPVLEKCASKSDNPVPEREGYRQEARKLEDKLNTPGVVGAVKFRQCMRARRVAAKFFSGQ